MDYTPQSVLFLHIAYAVIAAAQITYGGWIASQWLKSRRGSQRNR